MKISWKSIVTYTILGLIAVGIAISLFTTLLLPIIVFGSIFILYKFPPNRWGALFRGLRESRGGAVESFRPKRNSTQKPKADPSRPRVIEMKRKDTTSPSDPPQYH